MTIDDRLRRAHQVQLAETQQAYPSKSLPAFRPSMNQTPLMLAAAALVVLVVGLVSFFTLADQSMDRELLVDTSPQGPVAAAGGGPEDGSEDGSRSPDGDAVNAELTATPTPPADPSATVTPAPTATPTPQPEPEISELQAGTDPQPTMAATPTSTAELASDPPSQDNGETTSNDPSTGNTSGPTPSTSEPGSNPTTAPTNPATNEAPTPTPPPPTATPQPTATSLPTPTPEPSATPIPTSTPVPTPTPEPSATPTPAPTPTPTVEYAAGRATSVCPSGTRAELEAASLRYVSAATGWGRLGDLVNEQDGPYYFEAWEPNFPDPVSVEVTLNQTVLASDIRVFQDPFTPVGGTIDFEIHGQQFSIALSGVDGWRTSTFAEPTAIDRFTISRNQAAENIMEVMICVAPN